MSIPPSKDIEARILVLEQWKESQEIQIARLHEFLIRLQEMVEDLHPNLYD